MMMMREKVMGKEKVMRIKKMRMRRITSRKKRCWILLKNALLKSQKL